MTDIFRRLAGTTDSAIAAGQGEPSPSASLPAESVQGAVPIESSPADIPRNRARSRDSLFLVAQLQLGNERGVREVRVRNLSEGGLMLELDKLVEVGTPVRLDLRGIGETSGKVAWCTEGRIGVALDSPIDPKKARKPIGGMRAVSPTFRAKAPDRTPER